MLNFMKLHFYILFLIISNNIFGQNLIPNPNFELDSNQKHDFIQLENVKSWEHSTSIAYFSRNYIQDKNYRKVGIVFRPNLSIPYNE